MILDLDELSKMTKEEREKLFNLNAEEVVTKMTQDAAMAQR